MAVSHAFFYLFFFGCWATLSSLSIKKRIILDILQVSRACSAKLCMLTIILFISPSHKWIHTQMVLEWKNSHKPPQICSRSLMLKYIFKIIYSSEIFNNEIRVKKYVCRRYIIMMMHWSTGIIQLKLNSYYWLISCININRRQASVLSSFFLI